MIIQIPRYLLYLHLIHLILSCLYNFFSVARRESRNEREGTKGGLDEKIDFEYIKA